MPWAGVCKKCDFFCLAGALSGIKEMFKEHYTAKHRGVSLNLPYNMADLNKEKLIYVSERGSEWKSNQYDDNNIWVGVITTVHFNGLSTLIKNPDTSKKTLDYLKKIY